MTMDKNRLLFLITLHERGRRVLLYVFVVKSKLDISPQNLIDVVIRKCGVFYIVCSFDTIVSW